MKLFMILSGLLIFCSMQLFAAEGSNSVQRYNFVCFAERKDPVLYDLICKADPRMADDRQQVERWIDRKVSDNGLNQEHKDIIRAGLAGFYKMGYHYSDSTMLRAIASKGDNDGPIEYLIQTRSLNVLIDMVASGRAREAIISMLHYYVTNKQK